MPRNTFSAFAYAAAAFLVLLASTASVTLPASAQQAPPPSWLATGPDGTLYLVTDKGYYEVTPGSRVTDSSALRPIATAKLSRAARILPRLDEPAYTGR